MRNLFVVTVAVSAALASVGCKKKANDADAAYAKLSGFKDQMCGCKDKACVDKVQDDMMKWGEEQAKAMGDKKPKMSDADQKKFADATMKMTECAQKAMGAGSDMMNPPAGSAAAGSAAAADGSAAGSAAPEATGPMIEAKDMKIRQPEQNGDNGASASLYSDKNGEELYLQIEDVRNRPYMIKYFETPPDKGTTDKVGDLPAWVKPDGEYGPELSVLANKEGLIIEVATARLAPKHDVESLKKTVALFDLAGLAKADMSKPELNGKILAKYLPKLPEQKD